MQLQLVLHDDATETFEFSNPAGRSESVKDRDSVKTHLLNLMQKSRTKLVELERRARVLARDPRLFTLYRDLVTTDVLTPEEFWKYYSDEAQILENANGNSFAVTVLNLAFCYYASLVTKQGQVSEAIH